MTYTARGKAEADAFQMWSPADNPRLRCRPTSIIFDWVFDGAVNRITQEQDRIVINYGLYSFERVIHMNMAQHPAEHHAELRRAFDRPLGRRRARRRHGRLRARRHRGARAHSDQLHIVERFSLDPEKWVLTREFVAEDPVYFTDQYKGSRSGARRRRAVRGAPLQRARAGVSSQGGAR